MSLEQLQQAVKLLTEKKKVTGCQNFTAIVRKLRVSSRD